MSHLGSFRPFRLVEFLQFLLTNVVSNRTLTICERANASLWKRTRAGAPNTAGEMCIGAERRPYMQSKRQKQTFSIGSEYSNANYSNYGKFFRKRMREASKSIRRICDGYLPLTGSRHNCRREWVIIRAVIQTPFG